MNLIDESFENEKQAKVKDSKKMSKIILIIMAILVIAIIGIFVAIVYIQETTLKLYINGATNEKVKSIMVTDTDGTIYFPIRDFASYLGYESFSGEYTDKSEDASKCYIQNENEIANFALNSNKIYKLETSNNTANYEYFYAKKPVKAINGKLYASTDALEEAFNMSFSYDTEKQRIYIYTMPFLIESYATRVLDYGYEKISEEFVNQKTVLNNMLVVTKNNDKVYGVIDVKGNDIIEPKYDYIEYLPNSGDFLVKSNNKVGIISAKRETKVQILYDSLELIDSDSGLYLAKRDNKYGVIDSKGNIKIYIEYDQIGIDSTYFAQNDIKNKYLLTNGMIPARKDKMWGAFDKNGRTVLDFIYEGFGYIASNNKDAINLLMIPDYEVMVARRDKKYTLVNSVGKEECMPVLDDVYMTINAGKKYYYMNFNNYEGVSVTDFLDQQGVKPNSNKTKTNNEENKDDNVNEIENTVENTTENDVVENDNTVETSASTQEPEEDQETEANSDEQTPEDIEQ